MKTVFYKSALLFSSFTTRPYSHSKVKRKLRPLTFVDHSDYTVNQCFSKDSPQNGAWLWLLPHLLLSNWWNMRLDFTVLLQPLHSSHPRLRTLCFCLLGTQVYPEWGKSTSIGLCWYKAVESTYTCWGFQESVLSNRHCVTLTTCLSTCVSLWEFLCSLFFSAWGYLVLQMYCHFLNVLVTFSSFRQFRDALAGAFWECRCSGSCRHNVSCLRMQIREGWKVKRHTTSIGKIILSSLSVMQQGNVVLQEKQNMLTGSLIHIYYAPFFNMRR